jgi:allantoinase
MVASLAEGAVMIPLPRDRVPYSAIIDRPTLRLPGDARVVVWTIVNVEDWDIAGPMPRQVLPAPSGAQVIPDVPNWAWHEYGMRVGFWRLKAALDLHAIKATLSVNASVCLNYPRVAQAARDAGWEFMAHAFVQKPIHLVADQCDAIRRSIATIRDFTGRAPRGWLGPGLTETLDTVDLLKAEGIEYVADWVLDEQPCVIGTAHGPLVSLPYTVELNDIPMMMVQHHRAEEMYDRAMAQFERLHQEGAASARVMAIAVHPYITGVPHRIAAFERVYAALACRPGVLFWTGEQILEWFTAQAANA